MTTTEAKTAIETVLKDEAQRKAAAELRAEWHDLLQKIASSFAGLVEPVSK